MKVNIADKLEKGEIEFKTNQNEFLEVIDFGVTVLDCVYTNPIKGWELSNYSFKGLTKIKVRVKGTVKDVSEYECYYSGTIKEKDGEITINNPIIISPK